VSAQRDASEPRTRHERLAAIAAEYTEEIHDPRAERQLSRLEPVSRYAAVTSEGSPDSSYASNGNLLIADSAGDLAVQLGGECGEGWLAHGRAWDLDAPWHSWGNLGVAYSVSVGDGYRSPVHCVSVEFREDGVYAFEDPADASAFLEVVRLHGGRAVLSELALQDHRGAERLIDAERECG
jgi:hypothetical protein